MRTLTMQNRLHVENLSGEVSTLHGVVIRVEVAARENGVYAHAPAERGV